VMLGDVMLGDGQALEVTIGIGGRDGSQWVVKGHGFYQFVPTRRFCLASVWRFGPGQGMGSLFI
jgi:hypothetical protein